MKNLKLFGLLLFGMTTLVSCDDEDDKILLPPVINEEELITTVIMTLTGGGQTITFTARDLDGDGPLAPEVNVSGPLAANTTYTGSVTFLNEAETPVEDITTEVVAEGKEHQVFYQFPTALGTLTYTDADADGRPIGVTFTFASGNVAAGDMIVTLRHKPSKAAAGVAAGNIENANGSTDASVVFPIVID